MRAHVVKVNLTAYASAVPKSLPIAILAEDGMEALTTVRTQLAFEGDVALTGDVLSEDEVRVLGLLPRRPRIIGSSAPRGAEQA